MERKGLQKGGEVGGREGNDDQNWEVRPDGLADKKILATRLSSPNFGRLCLRGSYRGLKQEREGELIGERSGPFEK